MSPRLTLASSPIIDGRVRPRNGSFRYHLLVGVQGSLRTMAVPELMMWVSQFQKSGLLRIHVGDSSCELGFERGTLNFSSSSDRDGTLGRLLIGKGVITEEMHQRARSLRKERSVAVAKALCDLGLIPQDEITRYLRKKAEKELFDLFSVTDGDFTFEEDARPSIEMLPLRINVASLLLRITQQMDERDEYDFDSSGIDLKLPEV